MEKTLIHSHGNQLIKLFKSACIAIFNGIMGCDKGIGEYTRLDTIGCVVDYVIRSPSLLERIINFAIMHKFSEFHITNLLHVLYVASLALTKLELNMAPTGYHIMNINGLHRTWIKAWPCYATTNMKAIVLVSLMLWWAMQQLAIVFDQTYTRLLIAHAQMSK